MANQTCYSSIQLCGLRVAALDATGDGLAGASNGYVSNSLIEANLGLDVESGIEILKKNGCDDICVNFRGNDRVKRSTIDLKLCTLDSELIALLIGGSRYTSGSTTIGGRVQTLSESASNGVSIEFWTKAWNNSEQARPSVLGSTNAYWHWVIPKAKFQFDPVDLKDDHAEIALKGYGYENTALNIDGPFNDWSTAITTAGGAPAALNWFLDTTLPTAQCGFTTVPAQGS